MEVREWFHVFTLCLWSHSVMSSSLESTQRCHPCNCFWSPPRAHQVLCPECGSGCFSNSQTLISHTVNHTCVFIFGHVWFGTSSSSWSWRHSVFLVSDPWPLWSPSPMRASAAQGRQMATPGLALHSIRCPQTCENRLRLYDPSVSFPFPPAFPIPSTFPRKLQYR